jgi:hypothetical protein
LQGFLDTWDRQLAEWCADDLMRDGAEGALLRPLAQHRWAAAALVEHLGASEDFRRRKLAAILAGFIRDPPRQLLDDLFERESERAALAAPESEEPLYSQSVVEDVVMAASRWCREPPAREAACSLLRKVVERTIIGEYWSSACYALATLLRHEASHGAELLESFAAFAAGTPPAHASNPSLATEREFVRALRARSPEALEAVERMLRRQEAAAGAMEFDPETQLTVQAWLRAAAEIG